MKVRAFITVASATLALAASATAVAHPGSLTARPATPAGAFVGTLKGTNAFVAIVLGESGNARVYVYDSTKRIAAWFQPASSRGVRQEASALRSLDSISSDGYRVHAAVGDGKVSGSVRFPSGERHPFTAAAVELTTGVYQIEIGQGVNRYLGGWILWGPGRTLGYLLPSPVAQHELARGLH